MTVIYITINITFDPNIPPGPRGVARAPRGQFEPRTYRPERHIVICDARPRAGDGTDPTAGPAVDAFFILSGIIVENTKNR